MSRIRRPLALAAFAALCLFLSGCGIKPDHVAPPAGAEGTRFPATYPDPATDPRPETRR